MSLVRINYSPKGISLSRSQVSRTDGRHSMHVRDRIARNHDRRAARSEADRLVLIDVLSKIPDPSQENLFVSGQSVSFKTVHGKQCTGRVETATYSYRGRWMYWCRDARNQPHAVSQDDLLESNDDDWFDWLLISHAGSLY